MRRPDSLNLVIKTWYYVSWGSNKYHQLYPVLIEQNKNLSDKTFPQAGILFWTVALSQCIGILVATISFRFECFLSRDFLELYQNWNLKISICLKQKLQRKMYHCCPLLVRIIFWTPSGVQGISIQCLSVSLTDKAWNTLFSRTLFTLFYWTTFCDWITSSEIDWILRWRMFSQARQSNSKEITTYTHFLTIKQMRPDKRREATLGFWPMKNIKRSSF